MNDVRAFRDLHARDRLLILPNAWDAASAAIARDAGAEAIATTSAGVAWAWGYPDGNALPREARLGAMRAVLRGAGTLPVTFDFEAGYSDDPAAVADAVAEARALGAAGINLEDGNDDPAILVRKIDAIKRRLRDAGDDIFVNARLDLFLFGSEGTSAVYDACERARRYADAGADGIFVPALVERADIAAVAAATPLPLNVMAVPDLPDARELFSLGARRLSAATGVASRAYGTARETVLAFLEAGNSDTLFRAPRVNYSDMNDFFATPAPFVPRSGRYRIGSFMWFRRICDKGRAHAAGTLGDYVYPCPVDRGMMERWAITRERFEAALSERSDDASMYEWLRPQVSDEAVARANAWLVEHWHDDIEQQDREERGGLAGTTGAICTNCGVAYPADASPDRCPICEDERVTNPATQSWTTMGELRASYANEIRPIEPGVLTNIRTVPVFGIGQRAIVVETKDGCILWDCLSLVDDTTIEYVKARGGLRAIAISHPHFYGAMSEWSAAFGDVPVFVHENDREWVTDAPPALQLWNGDTLEIAPGVTLVRCAGHFEGGQVMHVAQAAGGKGALLTGDVIMVAQYGNAVSFMRSYPTYVPLAADQVRHLRDVVAPFAYEAIYGAWLDRVIERNGPSIVERTAQRYLDIIESYLTV